MSDVKFDSGMKAMTLIFYIFIITLMMFIFIAGVIYARDPWDSHSCTVLDVIQLSNNITQIFIDIEEHPDISFIYQPNPHYLIIGGQYTCLNIYNNTIIRDDKGSLYNVSIVFMTSAIVCFMIGLALVVKTVSECRKKGYDEV